MTPSTPAARTELENNAARLFEALQYHFWTLECYDYQIADTGDVDVGWKVIDPDTGFVAVGDSPSEAVQNALDTIPTWTAHSRSGASQDIGTATECVDKLRLDARWAKMGQPPTFDCDLALRTADHLVRLERENAHLKRSLPRILSLASADKLPECIKLIEETIALHGKIPA